jgi:hypothetical protein
MIDGEIYTKIEDSLCTFAFRDTGVVNGLYHYIGVNREDKVKRYGDRYSTGSMGSGEARFATYDEVERFKRLLKLNDYCWNKANKKVIRISTGELL